jgi:serine/threonine protein phosphatase PrpC
MTKNLGTSTCTILMLEKNTGKVYSAQIGDSCYLILRYDTNQGRYNKFFKSKEHMHYKMFNTPCQVGKDGDDPNISITNTHSLKNNDMIIVASDGYY